MTSTKHLNEEKKPNSSLIRGTGFNARRDLLLDWQGDSPARFEGDPAGFEVLAGQTAEQCLPWQLEHL